MKLLSRITPLLLVAVAFLASGVPAAHAQDISVFFGLGTAQASAAPPSAIYNNPDFTDDALYPTAALGGVWGSVGGSFMITNSLGVGAEYTGRFGQALYAPPSTGEFTSCFNCYVNYAPSFYDFNAVFHPVHRTRIMPEFQAGIGGADVSFYVNAVSGNSTLSANSSQYYSSADHFLVHGSAGVRIYVTSHVFVEPVFDARYVFNYVQFGSGFVPQGSISVGISSSSHR